MRRFIAIWRRHRFLVSALVIAGMATIFFAVRSVMFTIYWADPAHLDQTLAGWMTPGYVAYSWKVDRDMMLAAIGTEPEPGKPRTLRDIAERNNEPLAALIARIEAAIAADRARRP